MRKQKVIKGYLEMKFSQLQKIIENNKLTDIYNFTFDKIFFISSIELKLEDINPSRLGGLQGSDTF